MSVRPRHRRFSEQGCGGLHYIKMLRTIARHVIFTKDRKTFST